VLEGVDVDDEGLCRLQVAGWHPCLHRRCSGLGRDDVDDQG
jgi:hypothetical protein